MKYILHVFTDRDFIPVDFLEALNEACFLVRIPDNINFFRVKPSEFLQYRETMLRAAKERGYDTILFVDADSGFSVKELRLLMKAAMKKRSKRS